MEETLGSILQRHREQAGFGVERFEQLTKIPRSVIANIESNAFDKLAGDFYVRKYIRLYAQYLQLNEAKLITRYEEQTGNTVQVTKQVVDQTQQRVLVTPHRLKLVAMSIIALVVVGYLVLQVGKIFQEPLLVVTVPVEDMVITDNFIEIRGQTEREAEVYINNKQIFADTRGYFQTTLDLQEGINIIRISAKKKHSQESVIFREILVQ